LSPRAEPRLLELAGKALARRDLTESELDRRLARAGFPSEERARALERLREAGYLDDLRVGRERARRLAERGLGDAAIRADLERRGISRETAEQAAASLEPESGRAIRAAGALGGGVRAARALARKGFQPESIEQAIRDVANEGGAGVG
jgi:regulatory protein